MSVKEVVSETFFPWNVRHLIIFHSVLDSFFSGFSQPLVSLSW